MSSILYLLLQFELHQEASRIFFPRFKKENSCNKCLHEKASVHSAGFCLAMYVKHGQVSSGIFTLFGDYEWPQKCQLLGINATNDL